MKKKRISVFYTLYFTLVILFLLVLAAAMQVVTVYLADYEASLPCYEAERIFQEYYRDGSFASLIEKTVPAITPFENEAALQQYLTEWTGGKHISYTEISSGLDKTKKYIVKADEIKFSSFTLIHNGAISEKGFPLYEADAFELYISGTETLTITAPVGYTVFLNGTALDESFRTGETEEHISCQHMPQGVSGILYAEYEVTGLYAPPVSVSVLSPDGFSCPLTQTIDGSYRADILYSEALKAEHSEYVIAAAEALSAYMQNDGRFSTAAAYVDPDSELYVNLRTSETYFVMDHSSYSFEDVQSSEFYAYDENTFSCRVSFTHVLKRYGSKDYRDYIDMTLYLRRIGDTYRIYDRINH